MSEHPQVPNLEVKCVENSESNKECFFFSAGECCQRCVRNKNCTDPQGDFFTKTLENGY